MKTHTHIYPYVSIHTHTHFDLLALIFDCWKETQNGTSVTQNWNCPRSRTERTWPLAKRSPLMCWNSSRQCYIVLDLLNSFYVSDSPIGSLIYHNLPFGEPTLNIRVYIYTLQHTIYIHTLYTYIIIKLFSYKTPQPTNHQKNQSQTPGLRQRVGGGLQADYHPGLWRSSTTRSTHGLRFMGNAHRTGDEVKNCCVFMSFWGGGGHVMWW